MDSTNETLRGLLGNGLNYRVPLYQRDYSWKEEHWEDLWLDVEEVSANMERGQHYMGAVVVRKLDLETSEIVDGQQRLATLSIMILAAIGHLHDLAAADIEKVENQQRAEVLRNTYIGSTDPASLKKISKLVLNRNDDPFYQGTIVQLQKPIAVSRLSDSNKCLWQALTYFKNHFARRYREIGDGEKLARFINEVVALRLSFIRIAVENHVAAYQIFETLNARGLDLTASDLLKNYLMSLVATESDLRLALEQWERVTTTTGFSKVPEFLRHFLNSRQPYVRQERLYKEIRSNIKDAAATFGFLEELERSSVWYQALADDTDPHWSEISNPDVRRQVRALNIFNVKQYKPVILSAARHLGEREISDLLRFCVVISFRYNIIGDKNTNELEKIYNQVAIGIADGRLKTSGQLREALRPVYVADDDFRDLFARKSLPAHGRTGKVVRYILCELERQLGNAGLSEESGDLSIEHILPENISPEWQAQFSFDDHARFVHRLGNYTLLTPAANRDVARKLYTEKKTFFANSSFEMTKRISAQEWTKNAIEARQKEMAGWAATIWQF